MMERQRPENRGRGSQRSCEAVTEVGRDRPHSPGEWRSQRQGGRRTRREAQRMEVWGEQGSVCQEVERWALRDHWVCDSSPPHTSSSLHSSHHLRRGQGPQAQAFGSSFQAPRGEHKLHRPSLTLPSFLPRPGRSPPLPQDCLLSVQSWALQLRVLQGWEAGP